MTAPDITIVIPVHNRAEIIGRTLRSVAAQTFRPLRVILVDNNSTDGTLPVLEEWAAATRAPGFDIDIITEPAPGAAAARNAALDEVTTPYVMFFDSDDTMAPTHVARAMAAFHTPLSPQIVGWDIRINPLHGAPVTRRFYTADTLWHCVMHGGMGTQRYAALTTLVRRAGRWNPSVMGWNDIELGARMLALRPVMLKIPGITVDVHHTEVSITGTSFSATPVKWEHALDEIESHLTCKKHRRYVRLRRALLAGNYAREGAHDLSANLLGRTLASEKCPFYRSLYRLARLYTAHGGRGGARLLRPLF